MFMNNLALLFFGNFLLILFITSIIAVYFYYKHKFNYWKSRGVDGPAPIILFGTLYQIVFRSMQENNLLMAKKYGKVYGGYMGTEPVLGVSDPELIKDICIKDFHIFVNRNQFLTDDPLNDKILFNLAGDEWKRMRSIISPTFSTSKMRKMHPIIVVCVKRLEHFLTNISQKQNNEIELKSVMGKLTMDIIATCAFGTQIDVYNEEKTDPFTQNARKIVRPGFKVIFLFILMSKIPLLAKLGLRTFGSPELNFFTTAFRKIKEKRELEKRDFSDYYQLMLNAMKKSNDSEEQDLEMDKNELLFGETNVVYKNIDKRVVTEDELIANAFQFLLAGYETTASFLSFFFHSLVMNEKCQQKLYEEVNTFNGDFDYESVSKMAYLEACVAETLRLYNTLPTLVRQASENYILGDTGIVIEKGINVGLDVQTIHHNPDYYPEPNKWDPERFMPENRYKLVPNTYLPFGIGPRNCVGMRFALMESKTAIAYLVNRFEFVRTENTKLLTKPMKYSFILNYGDLNVAIKLRN